MFRSETLRSSHGEMQFAQHSKTDDLLVSLAESVGSTLGTIAAKAGAAQKALTHSDIAGAPRAWRARKSCGEARQLVSGAEDTKKKHSASESAGRRRTVKRARRRAGRNRLFARATYNALTARATAQFAAPRALRTRSKR